MTNPERDALMNRLDEIEARANAATEGPWEAEINPYYNRHSRVIGWSPDMQRSCMHVAEVGNAQPERQDQWEADTQFIAAARTDVPFLCAQIRAILAPGDEAVERVAALAALGRK